MKKKIVKESSDTMYAIVNRQNRRLGIYEMPDGSQRGPVFFRSLRDAKWFSRMLPGRDWKPKSLDAEGMKTAVDVYGEGRFKWMMSMRDGKVAFTLVQAVSLSEAKNALGQARMPLRHESLPPELETLCRKTFESVGKFRRPTYEQWELDFLRDTHPESELAIWKEIGAALRAWGEKHPGGDMKLASHLLAMISTGMVGRENLPAEYADLPDYYGGLIAALVLEGIVVAPGESTSSQS